MRAVRLNGQNVVIKRANRRQLLRARDALKRDDFVGCFSELTGMDLSDVDATDGLVALPIIWEMNFGYSNFSR